ncbi:unnamed protein product [Leptosia nina]|uniref:GDNF/GAS1 domain-containing protein n=1 Tax=Leptosia nina TaxID=320188 RepID=A0AAV1JFB1_9NEOP
MRVADRNSLIKIARLVIDRAENILGPGIKGTMAILNCLLARQLCFEDASCSAILEIIPRVCGSELVACSTVTVTKCQAALRTLQAFPFFKPTCLCREPNVDPECNSFRDFLFDHPCVFVMKKEKDPYPVETLPTCTYALSVCHNEKPCSVLFDRFKNACKARDGECRMEDRESCREAWAGLRLSPLFGCICPNTHMKKRCDRIFAVVNHNPCVAAAGGECPPAVRALFEPRKPAARAPPLTRYAAPDGTILLLTENGTRLMTRAAAASLLRAALLSPRPPRPRHGNPPPHLSLCVSRIPSPLALHAWLCFVR